MVRKAQSGDCFALPPGVRWTPVDEALALLKDRIAPVAGVETLPAARCAGRFLANPVVAARANPAVTNSAVDGYAFSRGDAPGLDGKLRLLPGRSAAGEAYVGLVPEGAAVRILTGAPLPSGTDTVVLDEDARVADGSVEFGTLPRRGANVRKAGEDFGKGDQVLDAGRLLAPQDMALMAAAGADAAAVRQRLRVGVLSTGSELRPAGSQAGPESVYDANRPMLLSLADRWGFEAVDLGCCRDDTDLARAGLDQGAARADVVLTTGGASAGDEDHVSRLLASEGSLSFWRIAAKPGRPLAMAFWQGVPVFGLPGNPVAAFVCALVFARPALVALAGGEWPEPEGYQVRAAFRKRKKAGRREYLRARLNARSEAEVYGSEGSGLTAGLSWSSGLVELGDDAMDVSPGSMVRFVPYGSFGL